MKDAANTGTKKGRSATGSPPAFHHLFGAQARRTPDSVALVDRDSTLSYRELDERSELLAAELISLGAGRDVPVGIYLERCSEYVVGMLASLKAGAAFLPIELAYPTAMVEEVVSDSKTPVILTKERFTDDLPSAPEKVMLDDGWQKRLGHERPEIESNPDDLAFVSYSSGTTGKPKGIANPHRSMVGSYLWRFGLQAPGDRVGCNVFFVWEALRPLLVGAATVVIPDDVIFDPEALVSFLKSNRVNETLFTPSLLESVMNHSGDLAVGLPDLETLWLNGEVVTKALAERAASAMPETRLMNVYSISETHEVAAGDLRELAGEPDSTYCPVGAPANRETVRVLDDEMRPVPNGEVGELYVGGDWLARGYVNLPEKTAQRFTRDPLSQTSGARMYRTGDRARLLPGGRLEVLGRCDFMVKVRGYSIELGAVESAIEETLAVKGCCVVTDGEEGEDKRLVAYLVPDGGGETLPEVEPSSGRSAPLRRALKDALPHYAVPSAFVVLDALPLQETTGKVDRAELPPPPERGAPEAPRPAPELPEEPTRETLEETVARSFERILALDPDDVGAGDDFFEIGGHSLAAAELLTEVEALSGVRLSIEDLLERPTPSALARKLSLRLESGGSDGPDIGSGVSGDHHSAASDATLDDDIFPVKSPDDAPAPTLPEAKEVFLTGATGFLGAFLLAGILDRTEAGVSCLVREKTGSPPLSGLRRHLTRHDLWRPEYKGRIIAVPGDLSRPRLGLDRETYRRLASGAGVVVHAGAAVNLLYPYASLRGVNVEGTREVVRLCCEGGTKPLHYISTNGVFPQGHGLCREDEDISPFVERLKDGYGRSKWAAEMLVRAAAERGLPTTVSRPGNISGDSGSGLSNPKDTLTSVLRAALDLGKAPDMSGVFEMTPVDFVADAVLELASRPDSLGGTFHLADPAPPTVRAVFEMLDSGGYPSRRLSPQDWRDELPADDDRHAVARATFDASGNASGDASHVFRDGNAYDDQNARAALGETKLRRPEITADLLSLYASRLTDRPPENVSRRAS